jgi:hypothetical protein
MIIYFTGNPVQENFSVADHFASKGIENNHEGTGLTGSAGVLPAKLLESMQLSFFMHAMLPVKPAPS